MKKVVLFIALALCYGTSQAQFGKMLKKKAKAAVEKKLDKKDYSYGVAAKLLNVYLKVFFLDDFE